jgi:head-tail adaptor
MNAGELRHRVYILTPTRTQSTPGGVTVAYTLWQSVYAAVTPLSGREALLAQQADSVVTSRVRMRYVRGLREDMVLLAPLEETALAVALTTTDGTTIYVVNSLGRANTPSTVVNQFYVRINSEIMSVTAGHGTTTLTVARAQLGTTGAPHVKFAAVLRMGQLEIDSIIDKDERRTELELACVETK